MAAIEQWHVCPLCLQPAEAGYSGDLDAWIIGCDECTNYGVSHGALSLLEENPELREDLAAEVREAFELVILRERNLFKIAARRAEVRPEFKLAM